MTTRFAALTAAVTTSPLWWHVLNGHEDVRVAGVWTGGVFAAAFVMIGMMSVAVEFMKPPTPGSDEATPDA